MKILVVVVAALLVMVACGPSNQEVQNLVATEVAKNKVTASTEATVTPNIPTPLVSSPTSTPKATPAPTSASTPSAPSPTPTLEAVPTPTLTPLPVNRKDVCYRSLPVQEKLIGKFSGVTLCRYVDIAELFRITTLDIEVSEWPPVVLQRSDFANMPNLRSLTVETSIDGLSPQVFYDLTGLEHLNLELRMYADQSLPATLLDGLPPQVKSLDLTIYADYREDYSWPKGSSIELPDGLFSVVPNLQYLDIAVRASSSPPYMEFSPRTLAGLGSLIVLDIHRSNAESIPQQLFSDVTALTELRLPSGGGTHLLYFSTEEQVLWFTDYCDDHYNLCVVVGTLESTE